MADWWLDEWVVVIEATGDQPIDFGLVQDLLAWLRDWGPSALYHANRYAVQLQVSALAPEEALRCAMVAHAQGAAAVGLGGATVVRAEVLTMDEVRCGQVSQSEPVSVLSRQRLVCDELYCATRALLRVTTADEVVDLLVRFVVAVGGSVATGEGAVASWAAGMVALDIALPEGGALLAVAEPGSAAATGLEACLSLLIGDSRLAVQRLAKIAH